ncbi:MAG TPA: hypothetical protein PK253_04155 [Spirochaetota bacterium]|nr:hypothetical protein [Spirochaetota bacterium]HPQ52419.1 hypothetical protein [Spirochaetota bacterium]
MTPDNHNNDDFDLESAFENDENIDTIFNEQNTTGIINELDNLDTPPIEDFPIIDDIPADEPAGEKKRSSKDFELNMDAILLTAQSAMIIEGIKHYADKEFGPHTLPVYKEALSGIDLYIKLIDRNPGNYIKLKRIIDTDYDCQKVENTVFNLYKKIFRQLPESNQEKVVAFEKFRQLFANAVEKATISVSTKILKKYYLLSGGLDEKKIFSLIQNNNMEIKSDVNSLHQNIKTAIDMVNKGNFEIVKGLRGKDLNAYIINASHFLNFYFKNIRNEQVANYYARIYDNFKRYFITK